MKSLNTALDLHRIYQADSSPKEPILVLIGPGADPSQELREIASRAIGAGHFHQFAMGKGVERGTLDAIGQCALKGEWLCLTNVHLVADNTAKIMQVC